MKSDYAALLAQVVPVVAIALGLEIRSLAGRVRAAEPKRPPDMRRIVLVLLVSNVFVLACVEVRALAVASGDGFSRDWAWVLAFAIFVAFLAPAVDAWREWKILDRE